MQFKNVDIQIPTTETKNYFSSSFYVFFFLYIYRIYIKTFELYKIIRLMENKLQEFQDESYVHNVCWFIFFFTVCFKTECQKQTEIK